MHEGFFFEFWAASDENARHPDAKFGNVLMQNFKYEWNQCEIWLVTVHT